MRNCWLVWYQCLRAGVSLSSGVVGANLQYAKRFFKCAVLLCHGLVPVGGFVFHKKPHMP
jgi:hypothetical protein